VTDLEEHVSNSENFRWHSTSTQNSQDRVRSNYRQFLQNVRILGDDLSSEDIDREMFLVDQETLIKRLKL
jgi:hypothetical protein